MGALTGATVPAIKASLRTTISTARAFTPGPTGANSTEIGKIIKCTARACSPGQMAGSTPASIKMIRSMVMVSLNGPMGDDILGIGKPESNTGKANTSEATRMSERENGVKAAV